MGEFKEPRELIPLLPAARDMLASASHRLHHAVWHDVRGRWLDISQTKKDAIKERGWQPGHVVARPAVRAGAPIADNGSGEDFLFMHRDMIAMVASIYKTAGQPMIRSWAAIPFPGGPSQEGFDIPPSWKQSHAPTLRRLEALKSDVYFWTAMRGWDRQFKNAAYLGTLSLGALGSTMEYTVHNDMHMRWSSAPRDPESGDVVPDGRNATDFSAKWLGPEYDFLGEFYSSHVNPVFWRLHGWVDERIEDWFAAHQTAHPGEIERSEVDGIPWFKPGRWVTSEKPWARPASAAHHHGHGGLDTEVMKEVIRILYAPETPTLSTASPEGVLAAPARSTWFLN
jgi:hypothetical protein